MEQVWDPRGEADVALARVVEGFGQQVLGRADMFEGLLHDDIPQLPREIALLTAAARSGVAELLAERVRQGISPQAAVTMAAAEMTARTAVDTSGALWAAGVLARVLGYSQSPVAQPPVAQVPPAQAPTAPVPAAQVPPAQPRRPTSRPRSPRPPTPRPRARPPTPRPRSPRRLRPARAAPARLCPARAGPAWPGPGPGPAERAPAAQVDAAAAPTALVAPGGRDAWGRPVPGAGGAGQDAARPSGDQSLMPPIARGGPALAIAAAVSVGVAAPIELVSGAGPRTLTAGSSGWRRSCCWLGSAGSPSGPPGAGGEAPGSPPCSGWPCPSAPGASTRPPQHPASSGCLRPGATCWNCSRPSGWPRRWPPP